MKTISRYLMTLALLLTAATGAWADEVTVTFTQADLNGAGTVTKDGVTLTPGNNNAHGGANLYNYGSTTFSVDKGTFTKIEIVDCTYGDISGWQKEQTGSYQPYPGDEPERWDALYTLTWTGEAESVSFTANVYDIQSIVFTIDKPAPDVDVTTNAASEQDLFTEASFNMPAFDATVNYMLVRDMQDETNPVTFSGLPSSGNIVVKKGSDGKYQPAEALTIQLIDPLAAADAQNIIAADGITVKVLVGNGGTPIEYDQVNPITLEAFLADMKPGYYWIKAEPTDENSPYDGTVYSSEFTVEEQYDLLVKPANVYSKGKMESVTVGTESVTPDATTGEATKTGIAPDTEVKLKAKRGYIIEKVETRKQGSGKTFVPGTTVQELSSYVEVENNKDGTITLRMPTLNPSTYNVANSILGTNGEHTLHFGYHCADDYWSGFIGLNISGYTWNGHTAFSEMDKTIDITSGEKYVYVIIAGHQVSATCQAPDYEHFWGMYCYTNPVKVTYDLGGGSVSGSTANKEEYLLSGDDLATTFTAPTREGYTFDGWYTSAEGGTKLTASNATSATTIYAHWTAIAE